MPDLDRIIWYDYVMDKWSVTENIARRYWPSFCWLRPYQPIIGEYHFQSWMKGPWCSYVVLPQNDPELAKAWAVMADDSIIKVG